MEENASNVPNYHAVAAIQLNAYLNDMKLLMLLFLIPCLFAYNASTASYSLGSFHYGLVGGEGISANYNSTNTLTNQQAGNQNATSFHYFANYGWFNTSFFFGGAFLTLEADLSFINATAGHAFSATATVSDPLGGNHITSISIVSTAGTCLPVSNSTSGINFTAVYVCLTTIPATTDITITFNDALIFSTVSTTTLSHGYPDHAPNLYTYINPVLAYPSSQNLTCLYNWADVDNDTVNITALQYAWYANGTEIAGQNNQTLANSSYHAGYNISCQINATNSTWLSSNATNMSANITILNQSISIAVVYPYSGSSLGMQASDCHLIITVETNATGNTTSLNTTCNLYSGNGSGSYEVLHSLTTHNLNASWNTTIPANFANYTMLVNCTSVSDATTAYSKNITFEITGTTFCTGGTSASSLGSGGSLIWLFIFMLLAILFLAGLNHVMIVWLGIGLLTGAMAYGKLVAVESAMTEIASIFETIYMLGIMAFFIFSLLIVLDTLLYFTNNMFHRKPRGLLFGTIPIH